MLQSAGPLQDPESLGERGRAPGSSTRLGLGCWGLTAPCARALPLRAVTQGWRAGLPQLRAPRTCLCVGPTGRLSPTGMERSRWIFLHQVLPLGSWGPPDALVGHPTAMLVHEALGSVPEPSVFQ